MLEDGSLIDDQDQDIFDGLAANTLIIFKTSSNVENESKLNGSGTQLTNSWKKWQNDSWPTSRSEYFL